MKRYLIACTALVAAATAYPARAELPPSAYAGPILDRIAGGFNCMTGSFSDGNYVLPAFVGGKHLLPGQYLYFDAVAKKCIVGGAPSGPQF